MNGITYSDMATNCLRGKAVRRGLTRPALALAALLPALMLGACSDAFIDPFENEDRFFTIYGFLDVLETQHQVRVIPVTRRPEQITSPNDPNARIDAFVTSYDVQTGDSVIWRHSLEKLDNGHYGHIFRANFLVQPGQTYRLVVRRNDGITAWAETKVPLHLPENRFEVGPFVYSPDSSVVTQEVYMPGIASPWAVYSLYQLQNVDNLNQAFFVPLGRPGERTEDGGWRFTINLTEDVEPLRAQVKAFQEIGFLDPDLLVFCVSMGARVRILDQNWDPPEGVFDPEVLAQPGALSNVVNGYGFWGSVGTYRQDWSVTPDITLRFSYN